MKKKEGRYVKEILLSVQLVLPIAIYIQHGIYNHPMTSDLIIILKVVAIRLLLILKVSLSIFLILLATLLFQIDCRYPISLGYFYSPMFVKGY